MIRLLTLMTALCFAGPGWAQNLAALARLDGAAVDEVSSGLEIEMDLSQPVPWRLSTIQSPPGIVIDFNTLTVSDNLDLAASLSDQLVVTQSPDGWSRFILSLPSTALVEEAGMKTGSDGRARLTIVLQQSEALADVDVQSPQDQLKQATTGEQPVRPMIVLDPGHGGLDPGAEAEGLNEKVLMLSFARELKEALIRGGLFDVTLTRERDEFVPLDTRITRAREAGATIFISLHADELPEGSGDASGITIYTLAEEASDEASRRLAERHAKNDLLRGVTMTSPGDEIALVLLDIARRDTAPRSEAFASALKTAFVEEGMALAGRPLRAAAFSVLKAADFPSVLIELGFLSSAKDRARLTDPVWRAAAVQAIESALVQWSLEDTARASLLRR